MDVPTYPSTRAELVGQGLTPTQIDEAIKAGDLVVTHRGLIVPREAAADLVTRCRSAVRTQREDVTLFGRTAAAAHALPLAPTTWSLPIEPIHAAAARDDVTRSARSGLIRHLRLIPDDSVVSWHGMRLTNVARTLCDLAATENRLLVVQMIDAAFTAGRCTPEDLAATLRQFSRLRHVCRQRELVRLARLGVDSPPETEIRLIVFDAGLPMPTPRLEFWHDGILLGRADLGYWAWLIWIEYDGYVEHTGEKPFGADRFRDRWAVRRGWEVFRLSNWDRRNPQGFIDQLAAAIREAPARIAAMPATRSPEVAQARILLGIDPIPPGFAGPAKSIMTFSEFRAG